MRPDLKKINAQLKLKRECDKKVKELEHARQKHNKVLTAKVAMPIEFIVDEDSRLITEMLKDRLGYQLGKKIMEFVPIQQYLDIKPYDMTNMIYEVRIAIASEKETWDDLQ